jgi:hypothetical protein
VGRSSCTRGHILRANGSVDRPGPKPQTAAGNSELDRVSQQYLVGSHCETVQLFHCRTFFSLILFRLPELQDELQKLIQQTESSIQQLPKPPSADPVNELLHLVADFVQDLSNLVEGTPGQQGLLQQIRPAKIEFKKAVRATAPNFRATTRASDDSDTCKESRDALKNFLANEEDASTVVHDSFGAIYIDEVMERALQ